MSDIRIKSMNILKRLIISHDVADHLGDIKMDDAIALIHEVETLTVADLHDQIDEIYDEWEEINKCNPTLGQ